MTTVYRREGKNKSFDAGYVYCDQCKWNGIPNQKIVLTYLGIRPADEPGFIHKFVTYDFSEDGDKEIHRHRFDSELIERLVDCIFGRNKVGP